MCVEEEEEDMVEEEDDELASGVFFKTWNSGNCHPELGHDVHQEHGCSTSMTKSWIVCCGEVLQVLVESLLYA